MIASHCVDVFVAWVSDCMYIFCVWLVFLPTAHFAACMYTFTDIICLYCDTERSYMRIVCLHWVLFDQSAGHSTPIGWFNHFQSEARNTGPSWSGMSGLLIGQIGPYVNKQCTCTTSQYHNTSRYQWMCTYKQQCAVGKKTSQTHKIYRAKCFGLIPRLTFP